VEPGEFCKVEANPDAIGLKLGIIYETKKDKQELMFHRFTCNNDSSLTITEMDALDIQYYGGILIVHLSTSNLFHVCIQTARL
jgi:hypothetical protein